MEILILIFINFNNLIIFLFFRKRIEYSYDDYYDNKDEFDQWFDDNGITVGIKMPYNIVKSLDDGIKIEPIFEEAEICFRNSADLSSFKMRWL